MSTSEDSSLSDILFQEDERAVRVSPESEKATKTDASEGKWKVLIVDDSKSIHQITLFAFNDFRFENKPIEFIHAYSGREAEEKVKEHKDIALVLLDVVMEEDDSGLKFAKYLREVEKNKLTRIVLRTGQPGQAPERKIIIDYDINDYKEKTELTQDKLFTTMVTALRSYRDLMELENKRAYLRLLAKSTARFVPYDFLRCLNKESILTVNLGDRKEQEMTVLFLDIRSFSLLAEKLTAAENFEFINELLAYIEPAITEAGGFIDKYMGDAIMALFVGEVDNAVVAAIKIQRALDAYNTYRMPSQIIRMGISINTGVVAIGTVGFHDRMDCTAISDTVNTAAKLEKMNKVFGTQILVTGTVAEKMHDTSMLRSFGTLKILGKNNALTLFEVLDSKSPVDNLKIKTKPLFEKAIHALKEKNLNEAIDYFEQILATNKNDAPVAHFLAQLKVNRR